MLLQMFFGKEGEEAKESKSKELGTNISLKYESQYPVCKWTAEMERDENSKIWVIRIHIYEWFWQRWAVKHLHLCL